MRLKKLKTLFSLNLADLWKLFLVWLGQVISKQRSGSAIKKLLWILFSASLVISTYLLTVPFLGSKINAQLNDVVQDEIRTNFTIRYIDQEETERYRREAYQKENFIFDHDLEIRNKIHKDLQEEFNLLSELSFKKAKIKFNWLKARNLKRSAVFDFLKYPDKNKLLAWAINYSILLFDHYGILKKPLPISVRKDLEQTVAKIYIINNPNERISVLWDSQKIISRDDIFYPYYLSRLKNLPTKEMEEELTPSIREVLIFRVLQLYHKNPTLSYNQILTQRTKRKAADSISPVTRTLNKGRTIAQVGELIDIDKLEKIQILNQQQKKLNIYFVLGVFIIMSLFALGTSFLIYRFSDFRFRELSSHLILHSLLLIFFLISFTISQFNFSEQYGLPLALFVPLGFLPTMIGLLFGSRVAYVVLIYASVYLYLLSGYDTASLLLAIIAIFGGVYASVKMKKRTQFFKSALFLGLSLAAVQIGMDFLFNQVDQIGSKILICFANSFISMLLIMVMIPVYEIIFNLATKFRLLELADSTHPLLKRLAAEAPSTYTHSLMVGNMAERAVNAIGGDSLLAKVGSLYHDIGKTLNPSIYAENKYLIESHDQFVQMGPYQSAKTIISHVTDGINLAQKYRLPEKLISFIAQHHGTTTIQYFYHKALEENSKRKWRKTSNITFSKKDFQYPGPKPQTKESAVVMIADSIEAASRSVEEPNRENFKKLIDQIIENKMNENQFDESPLTFRELSIVRKVFLDVLMSSHHLRPKYPPTQEIRKLELKSSAKKKNTDKIKTLKKATGS